VFDHQARADDERGHPPGPDQLWSESWYFDFAAADGSIGGYVRIGRYPRLGVVWYWACLVGESRPLVVVVDHEVPPVKGDSLEIRTHGLWADHNCETPLVHWSLGLEAFGVALETPAEAYGSLRGERVPLGLDLEWETDGEVFRYPPGLDRYEVPCRVHGEVLVGAETVVFDGVGQRDHSWGVRDWWVEGWCWTAFRSLDGTAWHGVVPERSPFSIGYVQPPNDEPRATYHVTATPTLGEAGIPARADLQIAETSFRVDPVAWAPVLLEAPDGRRSRFPRGLARFVPAGIGTDDPDRSGVGWIEFNQPSL
jgi:hypothetical protein